MYMQFYLWLALPSKPIPSWVINCKHRHLVVLGLDHESDMIEAFGIAKHKRMPMLTAGFMKCVLEDRPATLEGDVGISMILASRQLADH